MPPLFNIFLIFEIFEDTGIRISFEDARQYLLELWKREPTPKEIMAYQDFMRGN